MIDGLGFTSTMGTGTTNDSEMGASDDAGHSAGNFNPADHHNNEVNNSMTGSGSAEGEEDGRLPAPAATRTTPSSPNDNDALISKPPDPVSEKTGSPEFMSVERATVTTATSTARQEAKLRCSSSNSPKSVEKEDKGEAATVVDPILAKTTIQPLPSSSAIGSNDSVDHDVMADNDNQSLRAHTPPPPLRRHRQQQRQQVSMMMAVPGAYAFGGSGGGRQEEQATATASEDDDNDDTATSITAGAAAGNDNNNDNDNDNITACQQQEDEEEVTIVEAFRVPDDGSQEFARLSRHESIATTTSSRQQPDREQIEQEVRRQILNEAIRAEAVQPVQEEEEEEAAKSSSNHRRSSKLVLMVVCLLSLVLVGLGVGLGVGLSSSEKDEEDGGNTGQNNTSLLSNTDPSTTSASAPLFSEEAAGAPTAMVPPTGSPTTPQQSSESSQSSSLSSKSKLQQILERGYVKCGIYLDVPGFGYYNKTAQEYSGFNFQICRAVAAALFNDSSKYQVLKVSATHRFLNLTQPEDSVDLISQTVTQTMERDLFEKSTRRGFSFSYPFYFSGTIFGGIPEYVECADNLDPFNGICRGLKVCITIGSTQEAVVDQLLPGPVSVRFFNPVDAITFYNNGTCNVIAAEPILLMPERLYNDFGMDAALPFVQGSNTFSRDPLSVVTSDEDPRWSDIVNSVVKILYTTEAMGITSDNVQTHVFDQSIPLELQERIRRVVSAVGNIGELYEYTTDAVLPRTAINTPNTNLNTGLMYAYPFGRTEEIGPPRGISSSPTMDLAQERGYLKCGVDSSIHQRSAGNNNNGTLLFASLNMEMCKAIAGALFMGDASRVELIELEQPFRGLQDGVVDVLVGQQVTLTNEFFEPTTGGSSFSFSAPYYYGHTNNIDDEENEEDGKSSLLTLAFATRRDDNLWNSFVHWITMAVVYAEEEGITSSNAIEMPIVNLFGLAYSQFLRDCIASVGNYGDIYQRTLLGGSSSSILPRAGGNRLNMVPFGPQQVAYPLV